MKTFSLRRRGAGAMSRALVALVLSGSGLCSLAVALLLPLSGCSDEATYTYVDVHVMLDRATVSPAVRDRITTCEAQVMGPSGNDTINLRCLENRVEYDVGTFQWTTSVKSGALRFLVRMLDGNLNILAQATSDAVPVRPGNRIAIEVTALGVAPSGDGGTVGEAGTGSDGGVVSDAASTSDATDGRDSAMPAPDSGADTSPSTDAASEQPSALTDTASATDATMTDAAASTDTSAG